MMFKNPKSKRENPFSKLYNDSKFKTVLQHKYDLPKFPYLIDVELTNNCNLACLFCGQNAMTRNKGFISDNLLKKVVDECFEFNTPIRFIRWGEPFLHPNIINFCNYIKSKGLILHITNNGLAIKEKHMCDSYDSMIFSFQGATKEQYEIMRDNHRYDELKANIFKFVEFRGDQEKPFIHISSTMTNESNEQIDDFVKYWVNVVDSVGIGKTNLSRLSSHQIKLFRSMDKLELLKKQEIIEKKYTPCTEVYQKLSVDWDGKVTCCCGDFDNFLVVGDLNQSSLFEIWNNSRELKIFRELLDKKMHRCLNLCSTCYHTYEDF